MNDSKKIIAILLLAFFVSTTSRAQKFKDSTYKKEFFRIYDSIKKYPKDVSKSLTFEKELVSLTEKYKDTLRTIVLLHTTGRRSQLLNRSLESIALFKKELELLNVVMLNEKEKEALRKSKIAPIEVYIQLGNNYSVIGETQKGLEYYYKAIAIAEKEDLEFYKAVIPVLIGNLKSTAGEYKVALTHYKKGAQMLKKATKIDAINKRFNISLTYVSISEVYFKLHQIDSAKYILNKGLKEQLDTINHLTKINFETQRAKLFLAEKKYNTAKKQFELVAKITKEYDPISGLLYYYKDLAKYYEELKQYDRAIETMLEGIAIREKKTKEFNLTDDYKTLAKIYKKAGNIEKSNTYFEKYVLNQTALEKNKKNIVDTFHSKELSSLASEKENQKRQTTYLIFGSAIIISLLLLFLIALSKKRKKETNTFKKLLSKIEALEKEKKLTEEGFLVSKEEVLEEKNTSDIQQETFDEILAGLLKLETQEFFLKQDCNSYTIAKKIKTNTSYLSKVINAHYQKNFNTYINDLRINYVLLKLKEDRRFRSYSIQSISEDIGYKSPDSFTKYFKKRTGLLPSVYIKKLNNLS